MGLSVGEKSPPNSSNPDPADMNDSATAAGTQKTRIASDPGIGLYFALFGEW
jgi:hypothetical protein